jgi:methylenetetrahydrofolate reductase (NADPH)
VTRPGTFSFEFFPPKTPEGIAKLRAARAQLAPLKPAFCSVTFGAGGSTREGTLETVVEILGEGLAAAPHLSCIGGSRQSLRDVLGQYRAHGIHHLVALRGDLPSGAVDAGEFRYACDLVSFIREETGRQFHIDVACYPEYHPQAKSPQEDLEAFARKVRAGADSAITQYFFNRDAYWSFVNACTARGLTIPIVPGIMPILSASRLARFSDACGAEIPRWIRRKLESFGDDAASVRAFGLDVVTDLCAKLLAEGAPGLHFYTLNTAGLTTAIWQRLGLSSR